MRLLIFLTVMVASSLPAFAHKDRFEQGRTLTVGFRTGETVAFAISDRQVRSVTLAIGTTDYPVPPSLCEKLRDIRFETVSFLWNGSFTSAAKADYFYLRFDMGGESSQTFGELPQVELTFREGKFAKGSVRRKIAENAWREVDL